MKRRVKSKHRAQLHPKRVEEGILLYLKEGKATTDIEFGEVEVKLRNRATFNMYCKAYRDFSLDSIRYTQAAKDEKKMTITYLFHLEAK